MALRRGHRLYFFKKVGVMVEGHGDPSTIGPTRVIVNLGGLEWLTRTSRSCFPPAERWRSKRATIKIPWFAGVKLRF